MYFYKQILLAIIILVFVLESDSIAEDNGTIMGIVIDVDKNEALEGVTINIIELDFKVASDKNGEFKFVNIPIGKYSISFMKPGYGKTVLINILIEKNKTWTETIYLKKSRSENEQFYIGGIAVTAERDLLPEKAATTTKISSGEIEHIQASSIGDIIELIPGQKFTNPGLENVKQVGLRQVETVDDADRNASFGTQVIIDEIPMSNNANMQLDTDLNDGATYRITTNSGIDLRQYPAENIESIEVIRGIPPARYGDLSAGAILVETKSGYTPYRAKYKYNPRNKEFNLSGGYEWQNSDLNFNLNYTNSLKNIRVDGDSYSRLAGQLSFFSRFFEDKLKLTNRVYYTRTFDEQEIREGDITETERYNRNYEFRFLSKLLYEFEDKATINILGSVNMRRQNSLIKRIVSRDIGVIGIRMNPGTEEGYFVSNYNSELAVKGRAWNIFGQFEYSDQLLTSQTLYEWHVGLTMKHEFNNGPGREFDPRFPPRNTANEGDRPREYENIPGITQLSLYAENEITGHLLIDFSLQLGFRFDMFGFNKFNLSNLVDSNHGNYLNPRINLVSYITKNTQLRAGYGRTAKAPPMSMVYPNPTYFDVVDSMYYDPVNPNNRFSLVSTYIFDRTNENIKAETRNKYEISIDQKIDNFGLSLSGFYERMHNGFELSGHNPVSFVKYTRPNWPDPLPAVATDTILQNYNSSLNSLESITKGIELSLSSRKIPYINTVLRMDAAYHWSKSWWQNNHYSYASTLRSDPNLKKEIIPFWNLTSKRAERLIIHYRFDTIVEPLKLWFTLSVQQLAMEKDKLLSLEDSLAVGYVNKDGSIVKIPEDQRDNTEYDAMHRVYSDYNYIIESKPNIWLVNLRVSKELWKGSELSFFVNNLFNSRPLYKRQRVPSGSVSYTRRNPEIFYGIEFSTVIDDFIDYLNSF